MFNNEEAKILLDLCTAHITALHNHIASAVENPAHWSGQHTAENMVRELRRVQSVAAKLRGQLNG